MAYSLIGHGVSSASAGGGTYTSGSFDTTGADIIIIGVTKQNGTSPTLSDSKSNTWNTRTPYSGGTFNAEGRLYYAINPSVGSGHTFTLAGSSFGVMDILYFSGSDLSTPYDTENGAGNGSFVSSAQPGSITPSQNNCVVVSYFASGSANSMSVDSSMSLTDQAPLTGGAHYGGAIAYIIQTTAGAINPTWSFTGTTSGGVTVASFKAASGGGGSSTARRLPFLGVG